MKIKVSATRNPIVERAGNLASNYLKRHRLQVAVMIFAVYSILLFLAGAAVHKTGVAEDVIKPAIKKKRVFLKHWARGAFLAKPERITIDIKHTDFQKLEYKRRVALEMNKLIKDETDFVPAKIRYKGKTVNVDLRLKGDHTDHLEGDKWSFRIKVKGNDTLFGMKIFSIQHPKTRNYLYEWLYHKALEMEGLVALGYDFIEVTLNGKDLGIYALEEFFDKRLIENNEKREGPIIRFDETFMWSELLQRGEVINSGTYLSSSIDAFQTQKTLRDPVLREEFIKAISLLESFRNGELIASEVFDVEKLTKFFAISDLMGAEHATIWINMRFYFNPITSRLEPIGFDATCAPITDLCLKQLGDAYTNMKQRSGLESLYAALIRDRDFFRKYIEELERVSAPEYLENFFNKIKDEMEQKLNIIYKEFPYYNFSKDMYDSNAHLIDVTLHPVKLVNAYFNKVDGNGMEIEIGNAQIMDAEIEDLVYADSAILKPAEKILLLGKDQAQPLKYQSFKFLFPENFSWEDKDVSNLKVNCRVLGTTRDRQENVFPHTHLNKIYVTEDILRQEPDLSQFDFLMVDEKKKGIVFKPGKWSLSQNLIIPKGYDVLCSGRTRIDLKNEANIISYSPLIFLGEEYKPIVFTSSDSTGQGIIVLAGGEKSALRYVTFKNLSVPDVPGAGFTGAVTFYESPVEIYSCRFIKNRSGDDMLNIIRSEFSIENSKFIYTFSDAFDSDFGKGAIKNSSFIRCGNDGIDVSGSVVEIKDIFIDRAGDKGISVGEMSNVSADSVDIINSNIAVASKDMSNFTISNLKISNCNIGFALYKKKPEFGPSRLSAASVKSDNIKKIYVVEKDSELMVDDIKIQPNEKGVYKLLYGED